LWLLVRLPQQKARAVQVAYITTVSFRVKSGFGKDLERVFREMVVGRRELVARGDLLSSSLVRIGADAAGEYYQLISHWASKEAHDRSEDNPADLEAQRAATPFLLTPRAYQEVRHQRVARVMRALLIYGTLTGILLLIYLTCVFILQTVMLALIGQTSALAIVAATLAAAALLQPLRRRLQRTIDHRLYRGRFDAQETLEALSKALRHETDLAQLCEHILTTVQQTTHPAFAFLWLFPPDQTGEGSAAGACGGTAQSFGAQIVGNLPGS
jgi:quinol monooxygenase YgiN